MGLIVIVTLSILLQILAASLAIRLALTTSRVLAWTMITTALVIMGARRLVSLLDLVQRYASGVLLEASSSQLLAETLALLISVLMLAGVWLISPVFVASRRSREFESRYHAIIEQSEDAAFRLDAGGNILFVSPSVESSLGYRPEHLVGRPLAAIFVDPAGFALLDQRLRGRGGKVEHFETEVRDQFGKVHSLSINASINADAEGRVLEVEGMMKDQTHLKQADRLNQRLARIVEQSVNEIYVFDSSTFKFIMVNQAARGNLGYSMEELQQMTPIDLKKDMTGLDFEALVKPLLNQQTRVITFQTTHQRKNGSRYNVVVRLQLAVNEDPPIFFAVIEDITDRLETEAVLRQSQKMESVGQLTAGIAHDFNNLLTVIMGNLELIGLTDKLDEKQRRLLDHVFQAVQRGAKLTGSLLSFARKQALMPVRINLNTQIGELMTLIKNTVGDAIDVVFEPGSGLAFCNLDPGQFQNALINLCINARDAMPAGGQLTLRLQNVSVSQAELGVDHADAGTGDNVQLTVQDSGTGISESIRARIFEPFFTTKKDGLGTGLGLAMVYGFARQSGGFIRVDSEEGRGAAFHLYFPAVRAADEIRDSGSVKPECQGNGERVLLVEDDAALRATVAEMLVMLGYKVVTAASGREALERFQQSGPIQLLITDLMMPGGMLGIDLARRLREKHPELKVLYISGYGGESAFLENQLSTRTNLLRKPFNIEALGTMIGKVTGSEADARYT